MKLRLKGFSDQDLVEGGVDAERRAQDELNREQQLRIAMQSNKPEIARADLSPAHAGLLEHVDGTFYSVSRGLQSAEYDTFDAWLVERDGSVTFLQIPASGPRSRGELEEQRAEREQRRNAPKPRPSWMTR